MPGKHNDISQDKQRQSSTTSASNQLMGHNLSF